MMTRTLRDAVNYARSEAEAGQLTLCADHASGWDSDGSCPLCEGQQAAAERDDLRKQLAAAEGELTALRESLRGL